MISQPTKIIHRRELWIIAALYLLALLFFAVFAFHAYAQTTENCAGLSQSACNEGKPEGLTTPTAPPYWYVGGVDKVPNDVWIRLEACKDQRVEACGGLWKKITFCDQAMICDGRKFWTKRKGYIGIPPPPLKN